MYLEISARCSGKTTRLVQAVKRHLSLNNDTIALIAAPNVLHMRDALHQGIPEFYNRNLKYRGRIFVTKDLVADPTIRWFNNISNNRNVENMHHWLWDLKVMAEVLEGRVSLPHPIEECNICDDAIRMRTDYQRRLNMVRIPQPDDRVRITTRIFVDEFDSFSGSTLLIDSDGYYAGTYTGGVWTHILRERNNGLYRCFPTLLPPDQIEYHMQTLPPDVARRNIHGGL